MSKRASTGFCPLALHVWFRLKLRYCWGRFSLSAVGSQSVPVPLRNFSSGCWSRPRRGSGIPEDAQRSPPPSASLSHSMPLTLCNAHMKKMVINSLAASYVPRIYVSLAAKQQQLSLVRKPQAFSLSRLSNNQQESIVHLFSFFSFFTSKV